MTDAAKNTDREIWRAIEGDYYSPSIHVTTSGGIGINVGGTVFVKPVQEWHRLALQSLPSPKEAMMANDKLLPCPFCGSIEIDAEGWMNSEGVKGPACDNCGASAGSVISSTSDNVIAWNTRTLTASGGVSDEMVERAARAIMIDGVCSCTGGYDNCEVKDEEGCCRSAARAALEAALQPPQAGEAFDFAYHTPKEGVPQQSTPQEPQAGERGCCLDLPPEECAEVPDHHCDPTPHPASEQPERDIFECANQLAGYIDTSTPERLARFLQRESEAAASLANRIVELEAERDAAIEAENEAKDCFWAIYPDWVEMKGHGITTEAGRTMLVERARHAEAHVKALEGLLVKIRKQFVLWAGIRGGNGVYQELLADIDEALAQQGGQTNG